MAPQTLPRPGSARRGDAPADRRLLLRFAATRDVQDRNRLAERYLPLARFAASRYSHGGRGDSFDDLLQVASVGLLKAIDRFDPQARVVFASYAMPTMLGELRRHFRDHGWAVRPPRTLQEHALLVERTTDMLVERLGRGPTIAEIGAETHLSDEEVLDAREAIAAHAATSLSAPVRRADASGDDSDTQLADLIGGDDPGYERADDRTTVDGLLRHLSLREREILRLRLDEDLTQSEIGLRVGLSQMHVSRVLRDALEKLRVVARSEEGAGVGGGVA
jgi:RNA polymerase sigma-B factor